MLIAKPVNVSYGHRDYNLVFVEVIHDKESSLLNLNVFIQSINRHEQLFQSKSSSIVSQFLNFLQQNLTSKLYGKLLLVFPCIASLEVFYEFGLENANEKFQLQSLFCGWLDLTTLVDNIDAARVETLKHVKLKGRRLELLYKHLFETNECDENDFVQLFEALFQKVLLVNPELLLHKFIQPFSAEPGNYLILVMHIDVLELDLQDKEGVLPVIGSIGYKSNSEEKWFIRIAHKRANTV